MEEQFTTEQEVATQGATPTEQTTIEEKPTLTQTQFDKAIGERLARERKKVEASNEEFEAIREGLAEWRADKAKMAELDARISAEMEHSQQIIKEFEEAYPEMSLGDLMRDKKFNKFREGKRGALKDVYADYQEVIGDAVRTAEKKMQDNLSRTTQSGQFKGAQAESEYGLSDRQKQFAKSSGMSYEEYKGYLSRIGG